MTTAIVETLKDVLTKADPNKIADALRQMNLGLMFEAVEYDSGTITGADAITLPGNGALLVQSARVHAGSATFVGTYAVGDSGATPLTAATASVVGLAKLSADGKTITFPTGTTATRVIVRYIPASAVALSALFKRS